MHDFEHACEDHMCNFEDADYRGDVCPEEGGVDSSSALVAEAPWSVAEWAVALRFDNP